MKLYIDNQYTPSFIRLVISLHSIQFGKPYEIISGEWTNELKPESTVVFLWDTSKKGLSQQILKHYQDGYKVFTYKKPFGKSLDLFRVSILMLSQWKKMLETIEGENGAFLYTINDAKVVLKRVK